MAKKKVVKRSATTTDVVKVCAFWGLAVSAVLYVVGGIFKFFKILGSLVGILNMLGSIALAIAVAIPAYRYVQGKKKAWKVFYWIALIIYVLGVVLSII